MKKLFISLAIGSILIGVGIVLLVYDFSKLDYIDENIEIRLNRSVEITDYKLGVKPLDIRLLGSEYEVFYDEELKNEMRIVVYYYPDLVRVGKVEKETIRGRELKLTYQTGHRNRHFYKAIFEIIGDSLNDGKIYNYFRALSPRVEITINEEDIDKIRVIPF
jgi:hypothetical protein